MFTIITNFELKKELKIEKLGISFRRLSKREKKNILEAIEKYYAKHKRVIRELVKKYNEKEELFVSLYLSEKYDDITRESILFCWMLNKRGFKFNTKKQIENILRRIVVISYNREIIIEFVEEENIKKIISKVLSFYDIYSMKIDLNKKVREDYTYILSERDILDPKIKDYNLNIIMSIISNYDNLMTKNVELSEEYLVALNNFINKISKNEIRGFLIAIDLIYSNNNMVQNQIINNVMIIESILINSENQIKQNYTLKSGIALKQYIKNNSLQGNADLKELLDYTYDIRSSIVHGNEANVINLITKINKKNIFKEKLINKDNQSYNSKKNIALYLARDMSLITTRAVMKYWVDNPGVINYIKNN